MSSSGMGKVVMGCFFVLWCGVAFGIGYMALSSGAPFFFALIPFGMGLFGVVFCIAAMKGIGAVPTYKGKPLEGARWVVSDDEMYHETTSTGRDRRIVYQVPTRCPSCAANISTEGVDWVGPLQAKCPFCGATIDVAEREL